MRGLALALMLAAPAAAAQEAAPAPGPATVQSPVLVIKQDAFFEGSALGKAARAQLDTATQALLAENRRIEAGLEAEERALTERRPTLAADEFRALADAFDRKVEGIRTAQDAKSRAITADFDAARQGFLRAALPVLAAIMRERGAAVILDQQVVVVRLDAVDITAEAIARMDATAAAPPAPAPDPAPPPAPTPAPDPAPVPRPAPAP